jgi:hypothetical protein
MESVVISGSFHVHILNFKLRDCISQTMTPYTAVKLPPSQSNALSLHQQDSVLSLPVTGGISQMLICWKT